MRSLIIGLVVFLAACNGSSSSVSGITQAQLDAAVKPLQTQVDALQTQNKSLQDSLAKLTLIGKVHGVASTDLRMQGEFRPEGVSATDFGPCTDMGVLIGFDGPTNDPLSAVNLAFKQCTGYDYKIEVGTGHLARATRLYFDKPDCTGGMYEWPASGTSFNTQTLNAGVVFVNPADGITSLMVEANQSPQTIQVQSIYVIENGACELDGDIQPMYKVTQNDTSVTGVPDAVPASFSLESP